MKRRVLSLFLACCILLTPLSALALSGAGTGGAGTAADSAETADAVTGDADGETAALLDGDVTDSGECGADGASVTWTLDGDGLLKIEGDGAMADYTEDAPAPWAEHQSDIKTVQIENGVASIGKWAFYGCSKLTSVTIPDSVTSIGTYAFAYCSALTSVTIPDSVASIGNYAFFECSGLTSVTIPSSVTTIGDDAFFECSGLTSVTIGDSVTSIGDYAFAYCSGLTSVTIPDSVTSIGGSAFSGCSGLTSVTIGNGVASIGGGAFGNCASLPEIISSADNPNYSTLDGVLFDKGQTALIQYPAGKTAASYAIPDSVTSIGGFAFSRCSGLTSVTIPDSVISIGSRAFYECSKLTSVTIGDSVASIGAYAFEGCSGLTSVTIPSSVTTIESSAFAYCSALTDVYYGGSETQWQTFSVSLNSYVTLHYNSEASDAQIVASGECGADGASVTWTLDADGLLKIEGDGAMADYTDGADAPWTEHQSDIKTVQIGNGVTSVGNLAFSGCSALASVTIPDSATSIGDDAFYNCSALTSVTIPESVASIGDATFSDCIALTSVTIPDSVASIGDAAFSACDALTDVYYGAEEAQWNAITIGEDNEPLKNATMHYTEAITVLDAETMTLSVTAEKYGVIGVPYRVVYELKNVSEQTLRNVNLNVMGGTFVEDYGVSALERAPDGAASGALDTGFFLRDSALEPAETLAGSFTVTFGAGLETPQEMSDILKSMWPMAEAESAASFTLTMNERILISYDANGGGGEMEAQLLEKAADAPSFSYTFPECAFTEPEQKYFKAWLIGETEYEPGDKCDMTEDASVMAAWDDDAYVEGAKRKVKFDVAGGKGECPDKTVINGQTYGELPAPTRTGYDFAGWHTAPEGGEKVTASDTVTLSRNATLYAHWTPILYTIIWANEDGSVLETDESVPYGETPAYNGATPQKQEDERYTYSFAGWKPEVGPVSGDMTYTATYDAVSKYVTVTWLNYNGTTLKTDKDVLRGQTPEYGDDDPKRAPTGATAYAFAGWTPEPGPVDADASFTALYEPVPRTHTVTWVNEDGTELETDTNVPYGETPAYDGATPVKEPDAKYTYVFSGWTKPVKPIREDATYTAAYSRTLRTYTVTWANEDGATLKTDENVPYGKTPSYSGETPVKAAHDGETYVFKKWTPDIQPVSGDVTYTAAYRLASDPYMEGVTVSGETVTVTLDCFEPDAVALCAVYGENDQLIALASLPVSADRRVYSFDFDGASFAYAKAFAISKDKRSLCESVKSK